MPTGEPGYAWRNRANSFHAYFKSELEEDFFRFDIDGQPFRVTMVGGARKPASVAGKRAEYRAAFAGVDVDYVVRPDGVKETLTLAGPHAPAHYRFLVAGPADDTLDVARKPDGSWEVYSAVAGTRFALAAPVVAETVGGELVPAPAEVASLEVRAVRDRLTIDLQLDAAWLHAQGRGFPVLVDPTITIQPAAADKTFASDCLTCIDTRLRFGASPTVAYRSAVRFDLGGLPAGVDISAATLSLFPVDCLNGACPPIGAVFNVHRATSAWTESEEGIGPDFDPIPAATFVKTNNDVRDNWLGWNVTDLVEDWFVGAQVNHGFLVKGANETLGFGGYGAWSSEGSAEFGPKLDISWAGGVQLFPPDTVHANGAELEWARYDGAGSPPFDKYEVHRGADANFAPSAATLLATLSDEAITSFRDTTAAPNQSFTYKVVAGGAQSNSQTVVLPVAGQARKVLQPDPVRGQATFINSATPAACRGSNIDLLIGSTSQRRTVVAFDLREIPFGSTVTNASLALWRTTTPTNPRPIDVRRLTSAWQEGSTATTCTTGTTWYDTQPGVKWQTAGGDYDGTLVTTTTVPDDAPAGWDQFTVTTAVAAWIDGTAPNHGLLLRFPNESTGSGLSYYSDDYTVSPTLRPKLTVSYTDGSETVAPTTAVVTPAAGALVRGSAVAVTAAARDDGKVTQVEFLLDDAPIGSDSAAPFELSWNSTPTSRGAHSLKVRATDDAGNITTSPGVTVTVANSAPPTVTASLPTYAGGILAATPEAYWRLGEATGTTAADASGNGVTGTYTNSPTLGTPGVLAGDSDTSVTFDASWATFGDVFDFTGNAPFTLETWVKPTIIDATGRRILSKKGIDGGGLNQGYEIEATSSNTTFRRFAGGLGKSAIWATGLAVGQWSHVAATYDGTAIRLYVNGMLRATNTTSTGAIGEHATTFELGRASSGGSYFKGAIDETAVYDRALSDADVLAHYDAGVSALKNTVTLTATAADDNGVDRVEFYADGSLLGQDTTAPYTIAWDTKSATLPAYDGAHQITARAHDADGQVTTSAAVAAAIGNAAGTQYQATLAATDVPPVVVDDPDASPPDEHGTRVTVTNTSASAWGTSVSLRYRWVSPDATPSYVNGPSVTLGGLAAGASTTVTVPVTAPALPDGIQLARYTLRYDLHDSATDTWFASKGNPPAEAAVLVRRATSGAVLGLERYYHYQGEELGAGMQHLVNLANGNSLVRWTPFAAPGRGLSTVVDLTYNSLEQRSDSPIGNNFSLVDLEPDPVRAAARRAPERRRHPRRPDGEVRSTSPTATAPATASPARRPATARPTGRSRPASTSTCANTRPTDTARKWALTRPDGVTFFYDVDGYPTSVEERNGNRLAFTLEQVAARPGLGRPDEADHGRHRRGRPRRIAGAEPRRSRSTTTRRRRRRRRRSAARSSGSPITAGTRSSFDYYDDGNLLQITQRGGTNADGLALADRSLVFTYTTSAGDGPAIATAAARANPDPHTTNQSTSLFSVRDARGKETTFAYVTTAGTNRWKLASRTNRVGSVTAFAYDAPTRTTTVTAPLARVSTYAFDGDGQVVGITNPKNEATTVEWTSDRHVKKVVEPTGEFTEFAYNDNGYLTDEWDQLRNRTTLTYENLAIDANDVTGKWKVGRTIAHHSRLKTKTDPKGTATATPTDDYRWTFDYDAKSNVTKVTDPAENETGYAYNADGTLATTTDANQHTTTFVAYDANGLATEIRDAAANTTKFGYDDNGLLLWTQDPLHAAATGGDERHYRAIFDYDSFHRLGRQSAPKSTALEPGNLIWSSADYDANDNLVAEIAPHYGLAYSALGARTTTAYDDMDRPTLVTGPDTSVDPAGERVQYAYDAAGRVERVTTPKGVASSVANDFSLFYAYDLLDRALRVSTHEVDAGGAITKTLTTHYCYDLAGDLRWVTAPKAALATVDCSAANPPAHTTRYEYDDAHRHTATEDALARRGTQTYDANGNVATASNENGDSTIYHYDERNLVTKVVQPFDPDRTPTPRVLTSKYEYDAVGNLKRLISPRAWDASSDKVTFSSYVTDYQYDTLDRLVRVDHPTTTGETRAYSHHAYDANGNLAWTSLPVEQSSAASVATDKKTTLEYLDTGWIRTSRTRPTRRCSSTTPPRAGRPGGRPTTRPDSRTRCARCSGATTATGN